jgi:gluconolactonase
MFLSIGHIRAFDVQPDGTLTNDRVFSELRSDRSGIPDGMKVDVEGNVYCTGPGGLWVLDSSGKHLGTILTGAEQTTNNGWGGDDWKTMFITTMDAIFRIQLNIPGVPVPSR